MELLTRLLLNNQVRQCRMSLTNWREHYFIKMTSWHQKEDTNAIIDGLENAHQGLESRNFLSLLLHKLHIASAKTKTLFKIKVSRPTGQYDFQVLL